MGSDDYETAVFDEEAERREIEQDNTEPPGYDLTPAEDNEVFDEEQERLELEREQRDSLTDDNGFVQKILDKAQRMEEYDRINKEKWERKHAKFIRLFRKEF